MDLGLSLGIPYDLPQACQEYSFSADLGVTSGHHQLCSPNKKAKKGGAGEIDQEARHKPCICQNRFNLWHPKDYARPPCSDFLDAGLSQGGGCVTTGEKFLHWKKIEGNSHLKNLSAEVWYLCPVSQQKLTAIGMCAPVLKKGYSGRDHRSPFCLLSLAPTYHQSHPWLLFQDENKNGVSAREIVRRWRLVLFVMT